MQSTSIKAPFLEQFTSDWLSRWTPSEATKKTPVGTETFSYVGQWKVEEPITPIIEGDAGLVAKSKAAHHAISAPLNAPLDFKNKPLVVQYEVKYQKGGNCGGGYIKLLEDGFQTSPKEFSDNTPWVVMFGPDLTCPGTKVGYKRALHVSSHMLTTPHRFTSSSVIRTPLLVNTRRSTSLEAPRPLSKRPRSCTLL